MNAVIVAPSPATRRPRRLRYWLGAFALLLLSLPFGYRWIDGWLLERELAQIYREIDAVDPNWRWDDLIARLPEPPPAERNSAVHFAKIKDLIDKHFYARPRTAQTIATPKGMKVIHQPLNYPNMLLPAPLAKDFRNAFSKLDPRLIEELRQWKDRPEGAIAIDPEQRMFTPGMHDCNRILTVIQLLHDDALLRAHEQNIEESAESCQAILNLGRMARDLPSLMPGQITVSQAHLQAVDALERTLALAHEKEVSAKRLQQLQDTLEFAVSADRLQYALRGDRAWTEQGVDQVRTGKRDPTYVGIHSARTGVTWVGRFFSQQALRDYPEQLRLQNRLLEATMLPEEERLSAMQKLENKQIPWFGSKVGDMIYVSQALVRCALVAVAAERYRLQHGGWPAKLDVLKKSGLLKSIPTDPFDGLPVRMKATRTAGLVVYSVGPDRTDNGGKLVRANLEVPGSDLGFELWHPKLRGLPPAMPTEGPRKTKG